MAVQEKNDLLLCLPGYDPYRDADGFYFDGDEADRRCNWIEAHCTHIEGESDIKGEPYVLQPHELAFVANLFGWKDEKTGVRRYRDALYYIPRKNSKTTLGACINLCVLALDDFVNMQNYSCGADEEQAAILYDVSARMIEQSEALSEIFLIRKSPKAIVKRADGSTYRPLTKTPHSKHGKNAHFVLFDETHAYKSNELVSAMTTSQRTQKEPLRIHMTTAGFVGESVCNKIYEYAKKIRDGIISNPRYLPVIFEFPDDLLEKDPDCWKKEKYWHIPNPMLDKSIQVDGLREQIQNAENGLEDESEVKRLSFNIRTLQSDKLIQPDQWLACGSSHTRDDFKGKLADGAALDLACTSDMVSLCLQYWDKNKDGERVIMAIWWHWIPKAAADMYERKHQIPYTDWSRDGWIKIMPGSEIDYDLIFHDLTEIADEWPIRDLAVDRLFQGAQLAQQLSKEGWEITAFGQGFASMAAPTAEWLKFVRTGRFQHGNSPMMRWQAYNLVGERDSHENIKPSKKQSEGKIDGIVTAIMAFGMALLAREQEQASVYETRGPRIL